MPKAEHNGTSDTLVAVCTTIGAAFSAMSVVSLLVVLPASMAADKLGRKWIIIPSCIGMAAALSLMGFAGQSNLLSLAP